jgi:hypothetical protein
VYKHYYDSNAGVTLQDQYTASYDRWLACQQTYDQMLDRFRSECAEVKRDWRAVRSNEDGESVDDELKRLVDVLKILKENCEKAKEAMDRIRGELEFATLPKKEKIELAQEMMFKDKGTDEEEGGNKEKECCWRCKKKKAISVPSEDGTSASGKLPGDGPADVTLDVTTASL